MIRALLALASLAMAGCAATPTGMTPRAGSVEGNWRVIEVRRQATPAVGEYRMSFRDGQLSARFGCNHMGGRYRLIGGQLIAGDIASTLMGCPEPAATIERDAGMILAQPMSVSWSSPQTLELSNRAGAMKLSRLP